MKSDKGSTFDTYTRQRTQSTDSLKFMQFIWPVCEVYDVMRCMIGRFIAGLFIFYGSYLMLMGAIDASITRWVIIFLLGAYVFLGKKIIEK